MRGSSAASAASSAGPPPCGASGCMPATSGAPRPSSSCRARLQTIRHLQEHTLQIPMSTIKATSSTQVAVTCCFWTVWELSRELVCMLSQEGLILKEYSS